MFVSRKYSYDVIFSEMLPSLHVNFRLLHVVISRMTQAANPSVACAKDAHLTIYLFMMLTNNIISCVSRVIQRIF